MKGMAVGVVVPIGEKGKSDNGLQMLQKLVADDMAKVNQVIMTRMDSEIALIPTLAGHLIASGGKRLRPMLTVAAAQLCGYDGTRQHKLAAAVEFIHTATLLHDDVVDESDMRRGSETANIIWGNPSAVLVGDFLFSRAFQLMVEDGSLDVLKILADASAIIAEGEVMQIATTNDLETTEDAYLEVIRSKTAALFSAACRVGAVVAERPAAEEEALDSFGRNLGVIFQLIDDVLDYSAQQATLGKTIGDDFKEGKITLPVILAFRRGSEEDRGFWKRTVEEGEQTDEDLDQAISLMVRHNALADTVERARHYGGRARDALAIFPESDMKAALDATIDFCIERAY